MKPHMSKLLFMVIILQSFSGYAQPPHSTATSKQKAVLLDYYFNNEYRKDSTGKAVQYHYTWEDTLQTGFSLLGNIFKQHHVLLSHLSVAPDAVNLKKASIYIIVDPDTKEETANPNFITENDAGVIYNWIKDGGILLLMMNDSGHTDFEHTNILANKLGIQFTQNCINRVNGDDYETAGLQITKADTIFKNTKKIFIKELSGMVLKSPAKPYFKNTKGDIIMAISKVGKGVVFAVGDPWFYNEYMDNRILPVEFENKKAAEDLVAWLLKKAD
jgi:unsaturated rhamnogalacturonyl hydrolase